MNIREQMLMRKKIKTFYESIEEKTERHRSWFGPDEMGEDCEDAAPEQACENYMHSLSVFLDSTMEEYLEVKKFYRNILEDSYDRKEKESASQKN